MSGRPPQSLIGCPDCGMVQALPAVAPGYVAECMRCAHALARPVRGADAHVPLALAITGLLLLWPAMAYPLMGLSAFGVQRHVWLASGTGALWHAGFALLATAIFLFSMAIPVIYLLLMIAVLLPVRGSSTTPWRGQAFRRALQWQPWAMIEVYCIGGCIAYSRLSQVGALDIGLGAWCLVGATAAMFLLSLRLDERSIWESLRRAEGPTSSGRQVSCRACGFVPRSGLAPWAGPPATCPRCAARQPWADPRSMGRTLALVMTGAMLYVPANMLPVIRIERFGREQPNTILSGVRELITAGLWPLAALVFTASILVPVLKLVGLATMLVATRLRSRTGLLGRTRLYRCIDFIGRWSNIDLFMISILVALLQFGELTSVRPDAGAMAFAAVVIVTMLASRTFDPRIMWDVAGRTA